MPRDMTEDELRRFEEEKIHHRDEQPDGGPASDEEIAGVDDTGRPSGDPEFPPLNPD